LKLAAYIRVSTTEQTNGFGLAAQEEAIRSWARSSKHQIVDVFIDAGVSGTKEVADRPGLASAIDSILPPPQASGLVVARLDRLARTLSIQETVLQTVWRAGGVVFAVDQGEVLEDDPDDPMRTFVRQVIGGVAQLERSLIAKRMRDGRRIKAESGGYAFGAPPFGYRAEGRELVADPNEADTLARIVHLDSSGASLRQIAAVLEEEGRSPKRGGTRWHPAVIAGILRRARAAA